MEYWQRNEDGVEFDTEEDAYQDYLDNEDDAALEDCLREFEILSFDDLLHWAMGQEAFWERFQDEVAEARQSLFEDFYSHWDESDESERTEPQILTGVSMANPKQHFAVDPWGDLYEVNPTE